MILKMVVHDVVKRKEVFINERRKCIGGRKMSLSDTYNTSTPWGYEGDDVKEFIKKVKDVIDMHLQSHKRYGEATIETEMRFKDIQSGINELAGDALVGEGVA